jgi:hypothetical protein
MKHEHLTATEAETVSAAERKRYIGQVSADTRALVDVGNLIAVGSVWHYDEMTAILGRDIQGDARSVLESARRILEREYNIVFGVVRDVGLKHLTDEEAINTGQETVEHNRRMARKAAKRIASLKSPETVSQAAQTKQFTFLSLFGAIVHMTRPRQIEKLSGRVEAAHKELPLAKTLDAFKE